MSGQVGPPDVTDPDRWRRAMPLVDELLDLDPAARAARLDAIGRDHPDLLAVIETLLAGDATAGPLDRLCGELALPLFGADDAVLSRAGERVGPFRLLHEIGRGGMGAVYAAERIDGDFTQHVAVKILRPGLDSEHVLGRFLAERRILARLEHPHIARLIDGGLTEDGLPWFALERVVGEPITADADRRALDTRARLGLFLEVCEAVQFAHDQRVIHRDIKPSNVLVDARGEVKLLDFGIAKLLDAPGAEHTRTALQVFTPRYAAPEQSAGGPITFATDVWQLGRLLDELVPEPRDRDIDTIASRAVHSDSARRYASVAALAGDVRRFLDGQPILARGDSLVYRATRFLQRHPVATALVVSAVVALAVVSTLLARASARPESVATSAFALLSPGGTSQWQPSQSPDGSSVAFVSADDQGIAQVWTRRFDRADPVRLTAGPIPAARPRWAPDGRIVFERRGQGIWAVPASGGTPVRLVDAGSNPNLSRDGRWLVYERAGAGVWIARSDGSGARRIDAIPESFFVSWADRHPALSPDGSQVVYFLAVAGPWGDFWQVPVAGGAPRRLTFDLAEGGAPTFAPDGRSVIISSSRDGARTVWQVPLDGSAMRALTVGAGDDLWPDVSSDGRQLVYTSARTSYVIKLHDPRLQRDVDVFTSRTPLLGRPMLSPGGDRIAFYGGARAGMVRVFTVRADGSELAQLTKGDMVEQVDPQWSGDGATVYFFEEHVGNWIVSADGSVTYAPTSDPATRTFRAISSTGSGNREVLRDWVTEREMGTQVHPNGRTIVYTKSVSGSPTTTVIRDLATGAEQVLPLTLVRTRWSPDGNRLLGVTPAGRVTNCAADGTDCVDVGAGDSGYWSADGQTIVLRRESPALDDPRLVAIDVLDVAARGGPERPIAHLAPLHRSTTGVSITPDSRIAWIKFEQGRQELWSARLMDTQ